MPMTKSLPKLALRIKALADEQGLSISEIGRRAGKSRTLIQNLMSGYSQSLGSENLAAVARVLGTTPEYLLDMEERTAPDAAGQASAEAARMFAQNAEQIMDLALQAMRSNDVALQRAMIVAMRTVIKSKKERSS